MAHRDLAPPLSVRLSPEDRDWLAERAKDEGTSSRALVKRAVRFFRSWQANENIVEAALMAAYYMREYQEQVQRQDCLRRRLHDLRHAHRKRLRRQQNLLRAYQEQLRQQQNLVRAYERQLRDSYERQATEPNRDALYSPTVARLLALAVSSESDGEAEAAFAKARTLYRLPALSDARPLRRAVAGERRVLVMAGALGRR